jgi:acyl carrier protein
MSDLEDLQRITELLRARKCANERLDGSTPLDELEFSSIQYTSFLMDLEEEFGVLVSDEARNRWLKLEDIADFIEEYREVYGMGEVGEM